MQKKNIVILGCTGSIGESSLKVVRHLSDRFNVVGVAGGRRFKDVARIADEFGCRYASIADQSAFAEFSNSVPSGCEALLGVEGMVKMCLDSDVDFVLCGVVGTAGLQPVLEAIRAGKNIGLASKEILVMAGELVMAEVEKAGVDMIPVDSEHNAIFQCLDGQPDRRVRRLLLTCSGGPFRQTPAEQFPSIQIEQALKHPTWDMGRKITIDSATLMNKALEFIEAKWLFGVEADQVEVVIHPQSIVHSMVEFVDGSILAQMSQPDMVFPIQYAMTWPERFGSSLQPMDFTKLLTLTFDGPDHSRFPSIMLAKQALATGGEAPAVFNAANEVAVDAFLDRRIRFDQIWEVIRRALSDIKFSQSPDLQKIITTDLLSRELCRDVVAELSSVN